MTSLDLDLIEAEWPEALDDPAVPVIRALIAEARSLRRAAETLGEIVDWNARQILKIAGMEDPPDGDADYQAAWDRVAEMGRAKAKAWNQCTECDRWVPCRRHPNAGCVGPIPDDEFYDGEPPWARTRA